MLGGTEGPPRSELTKGSWLAGSIMNQAFRALWEALEESSFGATGDRAGGGVWEQEAGG